jgi:predicted  nucleic acid-binding Zn-ribbon protein
MIELQGEAMGRIAGARADYSTDIEEADMDGGIEKLTADVEHIRIEISDVKTDIRELRGQMNATKAEVSALRVDMEKGFGSLRTEMQKEVSSLRTDMEKALGSMRVMILSGNMVLAGGILAVMARAFEWI